MLSMCTRFLGLACLVLLLSSGAFARHRGWKNKPVKVPEPSIVMLTGTALAGLGAAVIRRNRS